MASSSIRNIATPIAASPSLRDPAAHATYLFRKLSRVLRACRSTPDPKSVHQLRTTIRRIQTLSASSGEQDSKAIQKFDRLLVDIFERAGKVRDIDVQIEALKTISLPSVDDDKALLGNHLQRQRSKRARRLTEMLDKELSKRVPRRQRRAKALLVRALQKETGANEHVIDLQKQVGSFVERLRTIHLDTETLHELRLELKHVRYAAEIAGPVGNEVVALLKPVQDAIGEWHDWVNLINTADKVLGPLPGHPLMTILRSKVRGRFQVAIAAVKPLVHRLSDLISPKRRQPVVVGREFAAAAKAV